MKSILQYWLYPMYRWRNWDSEFISLSKVTQMETDKVRFQSRPFYYQTVCGTGGRHPRKSYCWVLLHGQLTSHEKGQDKQSKCQGPEWERSQHVWGRARKLGQLDRGSEVKGRKGSQRQWARSCRALWTSGRVLEKLMVCAPADMPKARGMVASIPRFSWPFNTNTCQQESSSAALSSNSQEREPCGLNPAWTGFIKWGSFPLSHGLGLPRPWQGLWLVRQWWTSCEGKLQMGPGLSMGSRSSETESNQWEKVSPSVLHVVIPYLTC